MIQVVSKIKNSFKGDKGAYLILLGIILIGTIFLAVFLIRSLLSINNTNISKIISLNPTITQMPKVTPTLTLEPITFPPKTLTISNINNFNPKQPMLAIREDAFQMPHTNDIYITDTNGKSLYIIHAANIINNLLWNNDRTELLVQIVSQYIGKGYDYYILTPSTQQSKYLFSDTSGYLAKITWINSSSFLLVSDDGKIAAANYNRETIFPKIYKISLSFPSKQTLIGELPQQNYYASGGEPSDDNLPNGETENRDLVYYTGQKDTGIFINVGEFSPSYYQYSFTTSTVVNTGMIQVSTNETIVIYFLNGKLYSYNADTNKTTLIKESNNLYYANVENGKIIFISEVGKPGISTIQYPVTGTTPPLYQQYSLFSADFDGSNVKQIINYSSTGFYNFFIIPSIETLFVQIDKNNATSQAFITCSLASEVCSNLHVPRETLPHVY